LNSSIEKSDSSFFGNVAFNVLSLAAPLLFAFLATPLLVRGLGVEEYGYYSLVLAVIGFGFTTGIGRTPANYIPEKRGAGRIGELAPLLSASIIITFAVALIEAAILALTSPFLISRVLGVPDASAGQLNTAIYLACAIGMVMMLSQIFQSSLQGVHRFRTFSTVTVAASLLLNVGSIYLAVAGFPYTNIFIWNLAVTVLAAGGFLVFAKREVPEITLLQKFDRTILKKVGAFAASIFVYQTITSIFYLFERSYILRNYGPETLTYYTIPLMLGLYLHGVVLAISQVTIPRFNERIPDRANLLATYQTLTKLVVAGSVFLALTFYFLGEKLLGLWLGPDFMVNSSWLLVIDAGAFALIALLIPSWILSEAARKPGINASSPVVTYLVGMVGIVALGSAFGIDGVASGRLVGAIAALPLIFVVERLVFEKIQWLFWLSILFRVGSASIVILLMDRFVVSGLEMSWVAFFLAASLVTLAYWFTLFFSKYIDRAELRSAFMAPTVDDRSSEIIAAMQ
jgi:O-antigen/teichoic acid export membrane protein